MSAHNESTPTGPQWLKITLFCPALLLEPASDLLGVLSGTGVEQSPETREGALLSGFFPLPVDAVAEELLARVRRELGELFALYNCPTPDLTTALLADEDWATSWQQYFKPFEIVPDLVIKPSWEPFQPAPGQHVIELDPGIAFGTGQHASTQMALALVREHLKETPAGQALDVGTGTGILAMAAALFGAETVIAIDNDPEAVTVAKENVADNALTHQITVSGTPVDQIPGAYALVCANIVHDVLVDMAPELARLTAPGGSLVLAGILSGEQEANILAVYGKLGLQACSCLHQDEWASLRMRRA